MTKFIVKYLATGQTLTSSDNGATYKIAGTPFSVSLAAAQADRTNFSVTKANYEINSHCAAFSKLMDAADEVEISLGDSYQFYQAKDNTWRQAKNFGLNSTDLGRLMGGFIINYNTNATQKLNRLNKLNEVYGLGLTATKIAQASRTGKNVA